MRTYLRNKGGLVLCLSLVLLTSTACLDMFEGMWFINEPVDEYNWRFNDIPEEFIEIVEIAGTSVDGEEAPRLAGVWVHQCLSQEKRRCAEPDSEDFDPDRRGTLLIFSKGRNANLERDWDRIQTFWRLGYTVFSMDYRGHGLSTGSPNEAGVHADFAAGLEHVRYRWVEAHPELLGDDGTLPSLREMGAVLYGRSLGSAIAIRAAVDDPPQALVLESPICGAQGFLDDGIGLGLDSSILLDDSFDSFGVIPSVMAPKLFFHGNKDDFVRIEFGRELFDRAQEPKAFVEVDGADHGNVPCPTWNSETDEDDRPCYANSSYKEALLAFLQENGVP